jgi:hypothetical protein
MVNSIKLTKLEGKVLRFLSENRQKEEYEYPPEEGNDILHIASKIYGAEALTSNLWRTGVKESPKSSISRTLRALWNKGLVKVGKPHYRKYWCKCSDYDKEKGFGGGFNSVELVGLNVAWLNNKEVYCTDYIRFFKRTTLPLQTKKWWLLTDKGKEVAPVSVGVEEASP